MRLAAYIRVSRQNGRDGESFMSPTQQRDAIEAYVRQHPEIEIAEWFEEINVSGAKESRPKLDALLAGIGSGAFDGMIVAKLDRLSRSVVHGLGVIRDLNEAGKTFIATNDAVDPNTRNGRLMMGILLLLAEWVLEGITETWADVTKRVNERGIHQGDAYGYDREKSKPLTLNAHEAAGVKLAFELRAQRKSWKVIGDALLAGGYAPRRAAEWGQGALGHMLQNRVYLGEAHQGGDLTKPDAHPAIVDRNLFNAVQAVKGSSHAKTNDYLLSGLVRCQVCRGKMRGTKYRSRSSDAYRCRCAGHSRVNAMALESLVTEEALARHEVLLDSAHASLDIEALNAAVADAEGEIKAYASLVTASKFPELLSQGLGEREARLEEAIRERDNALATFAPEGVGMVFSLAGEWERMSTPERNGALKGLIDFVIVHPSKGAAIVWRGASAQLGPVPKTGGGQKGDAPKVFPAFPWPLSDEAQGRVPVLEEAA